MIRQLILMFRRWRVRCDVTNERAFQACAMGRWYWPDTTEENVERRIKEGTR